MILVLYKDNYDRLINRTPLEVITDTYYTGILDDFAHDYSVFNDLTKEERQYLCKHIASIEVRDRFDYTGEFIVARTHNASEVETYDFRRSEFCCGIYEEIIVTPNSTLMFGFTYGH